MDQIYKIIEIVGTSSVSIEDAIQKAVQRANKSLDSLEWFEVIQTRGYIEQGKVKQYQIILKVGFCLKDDDNSVDSEAKTQ